jgi:hypothetical protein
LPKDVGWYSSRRSLHFWGLLEPEKLYAVMAFRGRWVGLNAIFVMREHQLHDIGVLRAISSLERLNLFCKSRYLS